MPQVFFSTEPDYGSRAMDGDIIINRQGKFWIYTKKYRPKPKYFLGHRTNTIFKEYSDFYKLVPLIFKAHWDEYKEYILSSRTGRNPFLKNNIQLGYAEVKGTVTVEDITSPPQYPHIPLCFSAYYDTDLDGIVYEWLNDFPSGYVVESGYYNAPGLVRPPLEWMRIGKGYESSDEEALLHGEKVTAGHITFASIRSINPRGEVSPWATPVKIEVPEKPTCDFCGSPLRGPIPLEVVFNDLSSGIIKSWLWTFGDGTTSDEQHPVHTYTEDRDFFNVKLTVFGLADSKRSRTRRKYVIPTDQPEDFEFFFVCDTQNYRIFKRYTSNLSYVSKFGTFGTGDKQFKSPIGVTADNIYLYICDELLNRVSKYSKYEFIFQDKYYEDPPDPYALYVPKGIAVDDTWVYVCDFGHDRILKLKKYDLSYEDQFSTWDGGADQFNGPYGITVDDDYLYITDKFNHRVLKFNKTTYALSDKVGSQGSGDDQFDNPSGITVDKNHIFIADLNNHRIVKRKKSDLSFVSKIGTQGSGNDQFNYPNDVTVGSVHIFVADRNNHRIVKRLKSDLSYNSKIGSQGSGDDQFNYPYGIAILSTYSY